MNKTKILILLFTLFSVEVNAQVLTGKVFDKATGLPVYNANVYLNGSSYFTTTDDSGAYRLNVASELNTQLIVSHLAYETVMIESPFENAFRLISLVEKSIVIDEVAVTAKVGRFSRQQRMKAFELQFLGDNKARKFCRILNPDDIYLFFNETAFTLSATSEQPVIIENEYLGYQVHCTLSDFRIKYMNGRSLSAGNIESVLLRCYTFFIDTSPDNPVIKKRRDEAYMSSSSYFFKSLATGSLNSSKHLILNYGSQNLLDLDQYFEIRGSGPEKTVRIKSTADLSKAIDNIHKYPYPVSGVITVEDHAGYASSILFLTDEFSVDMNGAVDKWDRIGITGNMDSQRTGSMVPLDYRLSGGGSSINVRQTMQRLMADTHQNPARLSTADRQKAIPDSLSLLFTNRLEAFQQEKIYVHTDKPYYISGERIWFRAYLADALNHIPGTSSRYVYVELIDPLDSVVVRVKIRPEEGVYHGRLPIPEDASEGDYSIRAYTSFMRSQDGHYCFTKTIRIGDPQSRTDRVGSGETPASLDDDFDVSFYPEGGSLMLATVCNITFKAITSSGRATEITGIVYDRSGNEITKIESSHLGMGDFLLLAEKGESYYAVCENGKGQSKRFDLPAAIGEGYALSVAQAEDDFTVSVLQPAQPALNEALYLLAHTRGAVHFAMLWDNGNNRITLKKEQFPSGVLHLILFDAGVNPVSERLVFINNRDQAAVTFRTDRDLYNTRSLVKNEVTVTAGEGDPLVGSFSVSVTSDSEVMPDTASSILTHLLLASDLRGTIENPAFYFQNSSSSAQALDLLMRTQGWRRYSMAAMAKECLSMPATPVEAGAEISGTVKNTLTGRPVENINVIAMSNDINYLNVTQTDRDGRFSFYGCEAPENTLFILSAEPKRGMNRLDLIPDIESFPDRTLHEVPFAVFDRSLYDKYVDKAERQYTEEHGLRTVYLSEISVTAKQQPPQKSLFYANDFVPSGSSVSGEDIDKFATAGTNVHTLFNLIPGVSVSEGKIIIRGGSGTEDRPGGFDPLLVVDNIPMDIEQLDRINVLDIAQIDVLKGAQAAIFGNRGAQGVIVIYTKDGSSARRREIPPFHIKTVFPTGYQQPVEFYAPRYVTPEKRNAPLHDLRTTIHWQPVVRTDSQGVASFEFYTADEATSYTVVIEGLANDGRIIRQEGKVWIGDR